MIDKNLEEFIEHRNKTYIQWHGPIETPKHLVEHHIHISRQLGKTTTMLMSLPNSKCIVITHSHNYGNELKKQIKRLRPDYDVNNLLIVSYNQLKKENFDLRSVDRLRALNLKDIPVFVDSYVLDIVQMNFVENLNRWSNTYDV